MFGLGSFVVCWFGSCCCVLLFWRLLQNPGSGDSIAGFPVVWLLVMVVVMASFSLPLELCTYVRWLLQLYSFAFHVCFLR